MDCGPEGLLQTLSALHAHGIRTVGAGADLRAACEPLVLSVRGWTVAVLAYADLSPLILNYIGMEPEFPFAGPNKPGTASWSACDGPRRVAEMKSRTDVVVVQVHTHNWAQGHGSSWSEQPSPQAISFLEQILAAGADLVFGSGTHIPQGVIRNSGGVALLSLGNFHFRMDTPLPPEARRSVLVRTTVSRERIDLEFVPLTLDQDGLPREMPPAQRREFLDYLSRQSLLLGTTLDLQNRRKHLSFDRISE